MTIKKLKARLIAERSRLEAHLVHLYEDCEGYTADEIEYEEHYVEGFRDALSEVILYL